MRCGEERFSLVSSQFFCFRIPYRLPPILPATFKQMHGKPMETSWLLGDWVHEPTEREQFPKKLFKFTQFAVNLSLVYL